MLVSFVHRHRSRAEAESIARDGLVRIEGWSESIWLLRIQLAKLLSEAGDQDGAIAEYERVLAEGGSSPGFSRQSIEAEIGVSLVALRRLEEAEQLHARHLKTGYPSSLTHALAGVYADAHDWSSLEALQRAAYDAVRGRAISSGSPTPDPRSWVLALARPREGSGELITLAEGWATELGDKDLAFEVGHHRGLQAERAGDLDTAVAEYVALVEAGTRFEGTHERLLILLERLKRYDDALEYGRRTLKLAPSARMTIETGRRIARLEARLAGTKVSRQARDSEMPFVVRIGNVDIWRHVDELGSNVVRLEAQDDHAALVTAPPLAAYWRLGPDGRPAKVADLPDHDRLTLGRRDALLIRSAGSQTRRATELALAVSRATATEAGDVTAAIAADWGYVLATKTGLSGYDPSLTRRWHVADSSWRGHATNLVATSSSVCFAMVDESLSAVIECIGSDGTRRWRWRAPTGSDGWAWTGPPVAWHMRARAARLLGVSERDAGSAAWRRTVQLIRAMSSADRVRIMAPLRAYEVISAPSDQRHWVQPRVLASNIDDVVIAAVGGRLVAINNAGKAIWSVTGPQDCRTVMLNDSGIPVIGIGTDGALVYRDGKPRALVPLGRAGGLAATSGSRTCVADAADCYILDSDGDLETHVEFSHSVRGLAGVDDELYVLLGSNLYAITL